VLQLLHQLILNCSKSAYNVSKLAYTGSSIYTGAVKRLKLERNKCKIREHLGASQHPVAKRRHRIRGTLDFPARISGFCISGFVLAPCGRLSWLLPGFDRTLISHSYLLTYSQTSPVGR